MDLNNVQRNTDYWFSDGSIVLILQNVAFRVHKSVLCKHSEIFSDLFMVPQPQTVVDTMDGLPIACLSDNLDDFHDVLRAIYEPFYFETLSPEEDLVETMQFVSGILKISTKYRINSLRQKCISILKKVFPTSLTDCNRLLSYNWFNSFYDTTSVVRAITLAREANVPEILPWAFYVSTSIQPEVLINDDHLSWEDKALCLVGKSKLWELQLSTTHNFLFENTKSPTCQISCLSRLPQLMTWRRTEQLRSVPHPLGQFRDWDSLKVCSRCLESAQLSHQKGREMVWDTLPSVFNLENWEILTREKNR